MVLAIIIFAAVGVVIVHAIVVTNRVAKEDREIRRRVLGDARNRRRRWWQ